MNSSITVSPAAPAPIARPDDHPGQAVVSDFGGTAEVNQYCPSYGGPFCTYPWFALNGTDSAFTYGADYPGTQFDHGQAAQFATTQQCGGPFGPDSTYCDTVISPTP